MGKAQFPEDSGEMPRISGIDQSGHTFESLQYHRGKSQEISLRVVCPPWATKHRFSVPSFTTNQISISAQPCVADLTITNYDDTCRRNNECM